jgi:hypothetical protein
MMTKASLANLALFVSGLFFGGVLDHALLALQGSEVTPYQIHVGVMGNWGFALLDGTITVLLYLLHRRLNRTSAHLG